MLRDVGVPSNWCGAEPAGKHIFGRPGTRGPVCSDDVGRDRGRRALVSLFLFGCRGLPKRGSRPERSRATRSRLYLKRGPRTTSMARSVRGRTPGATKAGIFAKPACARARTCSSHKRPGRADSCTRLGWPAPPHSPRAARPAAGRLSVDTRDRRRAAFRLRGTVSSSTADSSRPFRAGSTDAAGANRARTEGAQLPRGCRPRPSEAGRPTPERLAASAARKIFDKKAPHRARFRRVF